MDNNYIEQQKLICKTLGVEWIEAPMDLKVGISLGVKKGLLPVHGLRHPPEKDTTGWYIWAGTYSEDQNFFKPLCIKHLPEWCSLVIKYLGLPPGYRFLTDGIYEDIWYDEALLNV